MTPARSYLRRSAALLGGSILALAILLAQGVRPFPPDTWLALGAGTLISDHGIPRGEPWTQWGIAPWIDQQWLGQWIIALVHGALGDAMGVLALAILPTALALAIAARTAHHLGARTWAIGVMLPIGALALAPFVMIRPQTLAFPLFAAALDVIIRGRERPERLWLLLPILILWANIHGTALLAAALALIGVAWARRGASSPIGWSITLYGGIALTPLISPLIADLPSYYARMLAPGGAAAVANEWQPLNAALDPALGLLVIGAGIALARRTPRTLPLALLALGAALATLVVVRFGPWLALTMCVLAPVLMSTWRGQWLRRHRPAIWRRLADGTIALCVAALALFSLAAVITTTPARVRSLAPDPAAAAAVPGGTILADLDTANWLLTVRPELAGRVVFDARLERYARQQLLQGVKATHGLRPVTRDDADVIVLGGDPRIRRDRVARMRVTTLYADDDVSVLSVAP